jgi:hypothetical protein
MRPLPFCFGTLAIVLCAALAYGQSLGEVARRQQQQKKASGAKVYTNDNLPAAGTVNVVGSEAPAPSPADAAAGSEAAGKTAAAAPTGAAPQDKTKAGEELKGQVAQTKKEVAQLEHDLDILEREFRIRAATYYADAGNSLRDPKVWADQRRDHDKEVAEKKTQLETAKQKLTELEEQARRSNVALEP